MKEVSYLDAALTQMSDELGVPRANAGPLDTPASEELTAGNGAPPERADKRRRQAHPAVLGRPTLVRTEEIIAKTIEQMADKSAGDIAIQVGADSSGRSIKTIIAKAREGFARRADSYAEIHYLATAQALANGDAKSLAVALRGAEFALERTEEDGARIINKDSSAPTQPSIQIGIALAGVPTTSAALPPVPTMGELPPLDATSAELVPAELMP